MNEFEQRLWFKVYTIGKRLGSPDERAQREADSAVHNYRASFKKLAGFQ